jgi:hypothetical protein
MPYIKQDRRSRISPLIFQVVDTLRRMGPERGGALKGDVNYTITRIVLGAMQPDAGWSYQSLSDAVAALRDAATEIERRLLAPYEDGAKERNGDVPEYNAT